jgi:methanethiol S-methyltransferase
MRRSGQRAGAESKPSRCRVSPRKADLKIDTHEKEPDMAVFSLLYAAFGYLSLLGAILWGMLFVGDGVIFPNMDAAGTAAPLEAACVDVGLLLLLALLHRSVSRGMLRHFARRSIPRGLARSTQAWAAAAVLAVIYFGWRPLPQVLWSATGPLQGALSALFYIAWTLILIGAFLASHLDLFEIAEATDVAPSVATKDAEHAQPAWKAPFTDMLRQPLYCGILMAVWATTVMTVGHMLLAATITAYLLFDALWAARKTRGARESRRLSLQGQRVAS